MEMFCIVNPASGYGRTGQRWSSIGHLMRAQGLEFDAELTEAPGHATELARQAVEVGYHTIVVVGGDGTLNEVVNGLVTQGQVAEGVRLGFITGGTGSDFARYLGIPRQYREAVAVLQRGQTCRADIGQVTCRLGDGTTTRYFVNVAGLGFDGEVADRVNRSSKAIGGTVPYLTYLFLTLLSYQNKQVTMTLDGTERHEGRMNSVIVCNGQYFGGGMWIGPEAVLNDGLFDVVVLGDLNRLEFLANVPRVYKGTHLKHPKVQLYHARQVDVTSAERMFLQAEGELIGEAPATFRVIPEALEVITAS